jgi:tRNA (mo5U34)-methyltransferase
VDLHEIAQREAEFCTRLQAAKAALQPRDFAWYPYDSLGNFCIFDEQLTAQPRFWPDLNRDEPLLDLGCGDGDLSFFLESLGYRVHAVDYPPTNYNRMRGVRALKAALNSSVEIHVMDLDSQFTLPEQTYGAAFALGLLYHLKNPFYLLETLARHARYCWLSTRIARFTPDLRIDFQDAPCAYLLDPAEANRDSTNYWIFSDAGLRRLLDRTHWTLHHYLTIGNTAQSDPATWQGDQRVLCLAESQALTRFGAGKLLNGWHDRESAGWRWTERQFSVAFPRFSGGGSATLRLDFALPEVALAHLGPVTLAATVNGAPLPAETYPHSGEHTYIRRVPAAAMSGATILVEFQLDKAQPPSLDDQRELGLIALSVKLE